MAIKTNIKELFIQINETSNQLNLIIKKLEGRLTISQQVSLLKERTIVAQKLKAQYEKAASLFDGTITMGTYKYEGKIMSRMFIGEEEEIREYLKILNQVFKQDLQIISLKSVNTKNTIKEVKDD